VCQYAATRARSAGRCHRSLPASWADSSSPASATQSASSASSTSGVQMLIFPEDLCHALVDLGFQVARFDNRDSGLSTHLTGVPAPGWLKVMIRPSSAPYRLAHMAGDAVAVLDALSVRPGYPLDEWMVGDIARRSYERSPGNPDADLRQRAAISASGDRRKALAHVRIPTLVLHGEQDPLISVAAGRAAAAIPGARLVTYPGMGHDLPRALWPAMLDEIRTPARTVDVPEWR
jgi:pimeloyl-ACP methyl ester carboxylesterase